jgi:hypothetical protein
LQPLPSLFAAPALCFQQLAASFPKTPGVGDTVQAEAVGGEACDDNGQDLEVGGGGGPEQPVSAELGEGLAFEPDHRRDGKD